MSDVITWRNVGSANFGGVAGLTQQGNTAVNQGVKQLVDVIQGRAKGLEDDLINSALNRIGSIGSISDAQTALDSNLVGQLGLSDSGAVAARQALEQRLSSLMGRETQSQQFQDQQTQRAERDTVNQLQLALANNDFTEANRLAQTLSRGGEFAQDIARGKERVQDRAAIQEDRNFRASQRKAQQEAGDLLRQSIATTDTARSGQGQEATDITYREGGAPFIASLPQGLGVSDIAGFVRGLDALDASDPLRAERLQQQNQNAYLQAVERAATRGGLEQQLRAIPEVDTKPLTGADIINRAGKELRTNLITDDNWQWFSQDEGQITGGLEKAIREVGDSGAVYQAFLNDPQVLEARTDEGGLGSWFDNIDFDKLTQRAKGYKQVRAEQEAKRNAILQQLAQLSVKPPKPQN